MKVKELIEHLQQFDPELQRNYGQSLFDFQSQISK